MKFLLYQCLFFIITITYLVLAKPTFNTNNLKATCGYESCPVPKDDMLNLHLVPHTHDDVGWLKTVDQYYYGSKTLIQKAGVQYIIDSVVDELLKDKNKKFIYVETAFFWKWWLEQTEEKHNQVKDLVENGQLEFIGGAWSMNDEATTHYHSIIDQFTWGLRRLNDTFGRCGRPKIGWQIDPFGHSREMASMFAQMGYDGLFFGRLDYQDKTRRLLAKEGEMIWRGSANLGEKSDLFTGVLYNNYQAPSGFCFDILCADEPIIDDKNSPDYNVQERVAEFLKYSSLQADHYKTNNIILTMGGDFTYQDAGVFYGNMDKLLSYINELQKNGSKVNAFYSTPSCYLKSLNNANQTWPVKSDDFFPYASDPHAYWTGYFSSRPTIKYYERHGNNILQVCKQLATKTDITSSSKIPDQYSELIELREAMGVLQHHDAVTGTEKQHVTSDYARILSKGIDQCEHVIANSLNVLLDSNKSTLKLTQCRLNLTECDISENAKQIMITVYNPSTDSITKYIHVPIKDDSSYTILGSKGENIALQISPISKNIINIPGRESEAEFELIFAASNVPPLGYKTYFIAKSESRSKSLVTKVTKDRKIGFGDYKIVLNNDHEITHIKTPDGVQDIKIQILEYKGMNGNNSEFDYRASGAYIFRPNGTAEESLKVQNTEVYKGPLMHEIRQTYSRGYELSVRMYKGTGEILIDWIVGPIPIKDQVGKEIILRYVTDLNTSKVFYTDSNGRELLRRERNKRDTWDVDIHEPVAGNYYPVTSRIVLIDTVANQRFSVLTDRSQGGSSLQDGQVELMIHRRLLHDDAFGVGEALNETAYGTGLVARGSHYILFGPNTGAHTLLDERRLAANLILQPAIFFTNMDNWNYDQYKNTILKEYHGLNDDEEMPKNVQILTLEPWKNNSVLLRLEHILEKNEDSTYSQNVCVNIERLFKEFKVVDLRETTLDGNQWLSENKRFTWNYTFNETTTDSNTDTKYDFLSAFNNKFNSRKMLQTNRVDTLVNTNYKCSKTGDDKFDIVLTPMQIRTFVLDVKNL